MTYAAVMAQALPLFDPYGDGSPGRKLDFIHVEPISARAPLRGWAISAHRHAGLFQIVLVGQGGGEMTFEATTAPFAAPCAILVPPTMAHGFRFMHGVTDGWVLSFSEDVALALGDQRAIARFKALARNPVVPLGEAGERLCGLATQLYDERVLARPGFDVAMRSLTGLIAVEVARLAAARSRAATQSSEQDAQTVAALRLLIEANFQRERELAFYAERLAVTVDRLNDQVKRATGVTAGHLIRQRLLTEARHQLVFTEMPIHEIARHLGFSDPSHFARFFRKQTGAAPHDFRAARGG